MKNFYTEILNKDQIDIYYLLERYSLMEMFSFVDKKYPNFDQYFAFRALAYFEDIGERERKRRVKKKIFEEVRKSQLEMLR